MRSTRVLVIALALVATAAGLAAAQDPTPAPASSRPEGAFGTIGGGWAATRFNYNIEEHDVPLQHMGAIFGSFGWAVTPSVLLGMGVNAESETDVDRRRTTTGVEGYVRWYPGAPPVFLRFGFGLASARLKLTTNGETERTVRRGVGLSFGIGYDVRLTGHLLLSPEAYWRLLAVGDFPVQGVLYKNVSANTWFLGAGLTIH